MTEDLLSLWRNIDRAGGIDSYIEQQLIKNNYLVKRKETDSMSKTELEKYKKALKEESAKKKELKKKAWQAYKASHIVHLGDGIFWNDAADHDTFDLDNAEERAAANELPIIDKPATLAEKLGISIEKLRWLTYHRDAAESIHYRRFEIPKRSGGIRNIWAPLPVLKEAQRWILRNIVEHLPVHGAAHGFLPGRSIFSNAKVHTNSDIVVRIDLKDFFPTVTFSRIKGIFRKAGYRQQIATLLALFCSESPREVVKQDDKTYYVSLGQRCLPQGAPTSPALSNVVCMRLDRRITGLCNKLGWRYTRYADDLTFSFPAGSKKDSHISKLFGTIHAIVQEEGFAVHTKKTWVARKGGRQSVTGLIVNGKELPRVPRKLKREMRAAIHRLQNGKETKDSIHELIGYAAFIYMVEPDHGIKLLRELKKFHTS